MKTGQRIRPPLPTETMRLPLVNQTYLVASLTVTVHAFEEFNGTTHAWVTWNNGLSSGWLPVEFFGLKAEAAPSVWSEEPAEDMDYRRSL